MYLHIINDTSIADIERVHDKNENDGLEDGFAHVLKHEAYEEQLRGDDEEYLGCSQSHYQ